MEYCPETGDGDLDVDWTATPHPAAEKLQCLAPPGKSGRGKKQLLDFLLALPWWVTLPDCRPQTQLCSKDLLLNVGALQSPACPEWLFQWFFSGGEHQICISTIKMLTAFKTRRTITWKHRTKSLQGCALIRHPSSAALGSSSTSGLISTPVLSQFHGMDNLNYLADDCRKHSKHYSEHFKTAVQSALQW